MELDVEQIFEGPKEIFYEEWPSVDLRRVAIERYPADKKPEEYPLAEGVHDQTKRFEAIKLAMQFRPKVILLGRELRSEKNSRNWGGVLFRVLSDAQDLQYSSRAVIQFIHVWTKQSWFVSLWSTIVPILLLVFLSGWINTDLLFHRSIDNVGGTSEDITQQLDIPQFLRLPDKILMIVIISTLFILIGIRFSYSKGKIRYHNFTLFILYGLLFALQILEFLLVLAPPIVVSFSYFIEYDFTYLDLLIRSNASLFLDIPFTAIILFLLSIFFLVIFIWQPKIPFIESQHEMDYAPVYVYLKKTSTGEWDLDYIIFDEFHYFCGKAKKQDLLTSGLLENHRQPILVIDNSWHSFSIEKPPRLRWILAIIIFTVSLIVFFLQLAAPLSFYIFLRQFVGNLAVDIIRRVIVPLVVFGSLIYVNIYWPTELNERENLFENRYHLTPTKLRILWNLQPQEAQLKIKKKMQDPFNPDPNFWKTFRN